MNATFLHPGPPQGPGKSVVEVMVVAGSVVGVAVVTEVVSGFVGSLTSSRLSTSAV